LRGHQSRAPLLLLATHEGHSLLTKIADKKNYCGESWNPLTAREEIIRIYQKGNKFSSRRSELCTLNRVGYFKQQSACRN